MREITQKEKGAKRQRRKKRRVMSLRLRLAKGEGRRCRTVQYWRISEAGIQVFPGTAEFMHYQELKETTLIKIPLLCGRVDKCLNSAALLFLLSELGQKV